MGAALVAADAALEAPEETAPPPVVVAAVAALEATEDALLKVDARDAEDSDLLEMSSEITDVADETAEEREDETSAASLVALPVVASHGISVGTTMPAVLQMLPAKAMAACWSAAEHSACKQLNIIRMITSLSGGRERKETNQPMLLRNPPEEQMHLMS